MYIVVNPAIDEYHRMVYFPVMKNNDEVMTFRTIVECEAYLSNYEETEKFIILHVESTGHIVSREVYDVTFDDEPKADFGKSFP
jgi:hypothetical protein